MNWNSMNWSLYGVPKDGRQWESKQYLGRTQFLCLRGRGVEGLLTGIRDGINKKSVRFTNLFIPMGFQPFGGSWSENDHGEVTWRHEWSVLFLFIVLKGYHHSWARSFFKVRTENKMKKNLTKSRITQTPRKRGKLNRAGNRW